MPLLARRSAVWGLINIKVRAERNRVPPFISFSSARDDH